MVANHFASEDPDFFINFTNVLNDKMLYDDVFTLAVKHYKIILKNEKYKTYRAEFIRILRNVLSGIKCEQYFKLPTYVFKPLKTELI